MVRALTGIVALLASACALSDKAVVANAVAARTYWEDRYERACVAHKGPAAVCADAFDALTLLERHSATGEVVGLIPLANKVQKIGRIPTAELKELVAVLKRLEKLP
jgi:hypothetical protein